MKKYIYIIIWLLSPIILSAQNNITQAQYWFDGQYSTEVTQNAGPTANFTLNEMIDVSGLNDGLHTVTYRFKDTRGVWGPVLSKFFTKDNTGTPGIHEITAFEYWFDGDYTTTQIGNASGANFNLNENIDVSTLINGLHTVTYRFKDSRGVWGPVLSKFFTKDKAAGIQEIVKYEYWFNDDYAGKTTEAVTSTTSFNLSEGLDISTLTIGVHTVNYRFQDDAGKWCAPRSWMFHNVPTQESSELHEVIAMEYWFNGDRSAVEKSAVSSNGTFSLATSLDVSGLNIGLHYVSYRFLDDAGNWSSVVSKFFSRNRLAESAEMHKINAMEYWFDGDYTSTLKRSFAATETYVIDEDFDISGLNHGLHFVSYRFQDETGNWSSVVSKMFSYNPAVETAEMREITEYEYWFDADNSSAIQVAVSNEQVLDIDETIDITALGEGLHIISYRFKDKSENWSPTASSFFSYFEEEILPTNNKIVGYRYWADDNIASATEVSLVTSVKSLILDELIDVANFPSGEHLASFQFVDKQGQWSGALSQTYSKKVMPNVLISASDSSVCLGTAITFNSEITDADVIEWKFGDGETSLEFTPEHTFAQAGSYEVTAIVTHTDSAKSAYDTIVGGITVHPVYIITNDKQICASEAPYIFGTQSLTNNGVYSETFQTTEGCDSTVVLTFTVNPEYETPLQVYICQGESYLFGTKTLTTSGIYKDTLQTINGCDSVLVLDLTVNPIYEIPFDASICEGSIYEFGGEQLTEANTYYDSLLTVNGCDSVLVLNLTVNPTYETPIEASICHGENYSFGGKLFTVAGIYKDTLQSAFSCDSVVMLTLNVNPEYETPTDSAICEGESINFAGDILSTAGIYKDTLTSVSGCDSVIVLNLQVNPVYNETASESICEGDSYVFGDSTMTSSGTYTYTFESVNGCDSTVIFTLTVSQTIQETVNAEICEGDSYYFDNTDIYVAGEYKDTLISTSGCDSVVTLNLTVNPVQTTPIEQNICAGDHYIFAGQTITTQGVYRDTLQSVSNCDSIVVLTLNINPVYETLIDSAICDGESVSFGGELRNTTGIYKDTLQSASMCDSIIVLNLQVNPVYNETASESICEGDSYVFGDSTMTSSGTYTYTFESVNGCDSTVTFTLTVSQTIQETVNAEICEGDSYYFDNTDIYVAGEYKDTLISTSGCDSVVTLNLTVNPVYETTLEASICEGDVYNFEGTVLSKSGTYKDTLQSVNRCDSILILNLEVNPVYETSLDIAICNGDTYLFGGDLLSTSGVYKDTLQSTSMCDSIIVLTLQVNPVYNMNIVASICEGDNYVLGTQTLTNDGFYTEVFATKDGCDSTVNLTLSVNPVYNIVLDAEICNGEQYIFSSQTLTESGIYEQKLQSKLGCDSTITLTLTVHETFDIDLKVNIEDNEFPYLFGSTSIDTAGLYKDTFQTVNGCDSIVTLYLNIADEVPPVAKCNSIDIALARDGKYSLTQSDLAQLSAGSTDDVTEYKNLIISATPSEFTCSDIGPVKVKISITDEGGNTNMCETTVVVSNNYPIQIMEVEDIELTLASGVCETKINYPYIGAIGPCVSFTQIEGLGYSGLFPTGTTTEIWVATNTSGASDTLSFTVTIISENKAPTIDALVDAKTNEDTPITINLTGIFKGDDCFENKVSLSVSNYDSGLIHTIAINYSEGSKTGSLEIIPVENMFGTSNITVEVEDGEGAITTESFTLTVNPVNDAPVLVQALPNQEVEVDEILTFSLSKLLGVLFNDVDNDSLSYTVRFEDGLLPDWISATDNVDMFTLNFAPLQADTGCYNIEIRAIDPAGLMVADTFEFCVNKILVGIDNLNNGIFEVNLYPNPSKGPVSIDINTTFVGELEVMIMNVAGSEVYRKKYQTNEPVRFDLSNHVSGIYMAIIKMDNKQIVKKFILDRK